jgi:hypothetical protein
MTEREIGSDTFIVSEAKVLAHRLSWVDIVYVVLGGGSSRYCRVKAWLLSAGRWCSMCRPKCSNDLVAVSSYRGWLAIYDRVQGMHSIGRPI